MKKLLVVLILAVATPAMASQVMVGRNAPRATPSRSAPPTQHNLTVDEQYDLSDAQAQIVELDAMIAELSAQAQAGTLTAEGRTQWQAYYEQRVALQATVDRLVAKRDAD